MGEAPAEAVVEALRGLSVAGGMVGEGVSVRLPSKLFLSPLSLTLLPSSLRSVPTHPHHCKTILPSLSLYLSFLYRHNRCFRFIYA